MAIVMIDDVKLVVRQVKQQGWPSRKLTEVWLNDRFLPPNPRGCAYIKPEPTFRSVSRCAIVIVVFGNQGRDGHPALLLLPGGSETDIAPRTQT